MIGVPEKILTATVIAMSILLAGAILAGVYKKIT